MRIGLAGLGRIGAFHASTLSQLDAVEELVLVDAHPGVAEEIAAGLGAGWSPDVDTLLASGIDGLVIATATPVHAALLRQAVAAGVPAFCEKPLADSLEESISLTELVEASGVQVQVGFQRRFDVGYQRLRHAVTDGELGVVHTIRANTHDQSPPDAGYIATSGGIFRDCNVHDFDAIRFVLGREVESVYATGGNKGASFFGELGDVATGAAVLTLDDGTVALVSSTRYNGGGHDVRMEVMGDAGTMTAGLDDSLAMVSAEPGVDFPRGPQKWSFMERFLPAYRAELIAFLDVARGESPTPCTARDALDAFRVAEACEVSRAEHRPVALSEIPTLRQSVSKA
jgi:myo-inositol 2-dehydrogenase/D-chiro-inositol 1-dehydrogenase